MMYRIGRYRETDLMSDLICENYSLLMVLSRFGIPLGFGDKSVASVCQKMNVDVNTFLAVVNLLVDDERDTCSAELPEISAESLLVYLRNSHDYFLHFRFPSIREKLVRVLKDEKSELSAAILCYFDEYAQEVEKHMMYEENVVFPYVEQMLRGEKTEYQIDIFLRQHNNIETKLSELKNIIIKYYPAKDANALNSVLFDIFVCAQDLASHNDVEDLLLVPAIRKMEK